MVVDAAVKAIRSRRYVPFERDRLAYERRGRTAVRFELGNGRFFSWTAAIRTEEFG